VALFHPPDCRLSSSATRPLDTTDAPLSLSAARPQVILDEIRKSTSTLIQDQYGNYVIQHVMKHGRPADRQLVIDEVRRRLGWDFGQPAHAIVSRRRETGPISRGYLSPASRLSRRDG
jgi:hypothetical protein